MVNGLPGDMGVNIVSAAVRRGIQVIPWSLTGPGIEQETITVDGNEIALIKPEDHTAKITDIIKEYTPFISIDFTHPTAVNSNALFYIEHKLPFVMGTTGGDREKLQKDVETSGLYSVIAPNMAKQIVALQAMLEFGAENFPGLYQGYELSVVETHQKTKADTSGTAKALVSIFNDLGVNPFTNDDIQKIRKEDEQLKMGVPENFLSGHAYHTYHLTSNDKTVHFEFQHNVGGRSIYAEGTIDAALFLNKKIEENSDKKLFTMIDVLKAGAMQ